MMSATELQKVYQAWQQGNDYYIQDWSYFVEWAARLNGVSSVEMMRELQKHYWFEKDDTN